MTTLKKVEPSPAAVELAQAVSAALDHAVSKGLAPDAAIGVATTIVSDYARILYGDGYLPALAALVTARAQYPMPARPN